MAKVSEAIIGAKFGRLAICETYIVKNSKGHNIRMVKCHCDCGNVWTGMVSEVGIRTGETRSCGCFKKDQQTTHGRSKGKTRRLYGIRNGMISRCVNTKDAAFDNYGGRGMRINQYGWDMERALSTPPAKRGPKGTGRTFAWNQARRAKIAAEKSVAATVPS